MSGSSLDGLDIAFCEFELENKTLKNWKLVQGATIPFTEQWQSRLANLPQQSAEIFAKTDVYFAYYLADLVHAFLKKHQFQADVVASHGHTIFHNPNRMFTAQIGDGGVLAAKLGIPVVSNFRTADIALGGEGAPFAPIVERWLYAGFDAYLNLGGIANLTFVKKERTTAHDVCAANQALNFLANHLDLPYDKDGAIAASGQLHQGLFDALNDFDFYKRKSPKSLGNEWIRAKILPIFIEKDIPIPDALHTMCHHIGYQVRQSFDREFPKENPRLLATGGGVYNDFLMEMIQYHNPNLEIHVPDKATIDYKEAILMALMGLLRWNNIPNVIASATGAKKDSISGAVYI